MSGKDSIWMLNSLIFHSSLALVIASPWLVDACGLLDLADALCNWRDCGHENLGYWLGYRV